MTWNQIENKWAAMARRVRADWKGAMQDDAAQPTDERRDPLADKKPGTVIVVDANLPKAIVALAE